MGASLDVSTLRTFLGEQSAAIWTDADLRGHLNIANTIVWKILSDQAPAMVSFAYGITIGTGASVTFTNPVATFSSGTIIDATSDSGIGVQAAAVVAVYETKSPIPATPSWRKLKVKTGSGLYPVLENSNSLFGDLEIPNIYQERMGVFNYGSQELVIHPAPTKNMTYLVEVITETPIYIKLGALTTRTRWITESSTEDSEFLGVERFAGDEGKAVAYQCHLAVIMEAAYQASFVDKSLRREFAAERDRLLALLATPHTTSIDEAY